MTNLNMAGETVISISPFLMHKVFLASILSCAEKLEKKIQESRGGRKPKILEESDELLEIRKIVKTLQRDIGEGPQNISESPISESPSR